MSLHPLVYCHDSTFTGEGEYPLKCSGVLSNKDNNLNLRGTWKGGVFSGTGYYKYSSGTYVGEWLDNFPHGKGRFTDNIGNILDGDWNRGKFTGAGTFELKDGVYTGQFVDGKRHGQGKFVANDSSQILEGTWENDEFKSNGKSNNLYYNVKMYDGVYTGEMVNGRRKGKGRLVQDEGRCILEGTWRDNGFTGKGGPYVYCPEKSVYSGSWLDGKRHGKGVFYDNSSGKLVKCTGYFYHDGFIDPPPTKEDLQILFGIIEESPEESDGEIVDA